MSGGGHIRRCRELRMCYLSLGGAQLYPRQVTLYQVEEADSRQLLGVSLLNILPSTKYVLRTGWAQGKAASDSSDTGVLCPAWLVFCWFVAGSLCPLPGLGTRQGACRWSAFGARRRHFFPSRFLSLGAGWGLGAQNLGAGRPICLCPSLCRDAAGFRGERRLCLHWGEQLSLPLSLTGVVAFATLAPVCFSRGECAGSHPAL